MDDSDGYVKLVSLSRDLTALLRFVFLSVHNTILMKATPPRRGTIRATRKEASQQMATRGHRLRSAFAFLMTEAHSQSRVI